MANLVDFTKRGAIGVITVNNPPVNALSVGVPQGIISGIEAGLADAEVKAMVLVGGGRTFISGADINEFGNPPPPGNANIHDVIGALEAAAKPVVAAIHGTALGGGLEVAMGCHYRVGVGSARFGLPEVKLGLLPGAGGTQRLPRLIGVEAALPLIVSGDFVAAKKARELGIIDEVVEGDIVEAACTFAEGLVAAGRPLRRVRDETAAPPIEPGFFDDFAKSIARQTRGQLAPELIVKCVKAAVELPFDEGLKRERELFKQCHASTQSKSMIHLFFAERTASKIPDLPPETRPGKLEKVGVVGAGTMGGGITMNFLNAGIPVTLLEVSREALDKGIATIERNYAATVKKGRLSEEAMEKRMALISPTTDYADLADADMVIEAVFEDMEVKRPVFRKLDEVVNKDAVLASNTSTLDIDAIAAETSRPEKVIGTHFFSPANVMRLLENVRGAKSSAETIATAMAMGKAVGKVAVLVGNCDGFVGNRMLFKYLRQAMAMVEEGAEPQQVDKALYDFGLAMGPFAMSDLAGLDVGWFIRKRHMAEQGSNVSAAPIEDRLCEMGRFGQKTGAGWYRYEPGNRTPQPDPVVEQAMADYRASAGITPRQFSTEEIIERCLYALVNEGAKILEEGIAIRASDIDVVYANGYGFPRWRGGPMFYADIVGLGAVHDAVKRYADQYGGDWKPSALLARLAAEGGRFNDR